MNIIRENKDLACFYTTKHSWRGRYKRVFSVGTHAITTYNPNTLEVTNQWPYGDICSISPVGKGQGTEFSLTFRKGSGKKSETLKFSTEHRAELLTEALRFRTDFAEGKITGRRYNSYKHHWSDSRKPVILEVTPGSFDQINPTTNKILCSYDYRYIEGFVDLSDYPGGFCIIYGGFSRLHLFASEQREDIIKSAIEHAGNYIGISLRTRKEPLEFEQYLSLRFGKYSSDEYITSLAEFVVQKISPRHAEPVKRILALTETCLVERDPASYNIATLKPLGEVFALVCDSENPQLFTIEFIKGQIRKYSSTERDSLLASLLDGVRASGNRDVCVKMTPTEKGQRWGLLSMPVDEEVESLHLRFLAAPPNGNFADAVFRFNSNISYSGVLHAVTQDGLFSENKEKLINNAITALLSQEGDITASIAELESQFQAVRRLVASKAGFLAFTQLPKFRERLGVKVVKALKRNNDGVTHASIDMLCALMCPMHDDYDLRQEQLNKASLLSSKKFLENLLEKFNSHVEYGTGALVISSLLDFLTFALCAPYSETTEGQQFDMLLEMVASNGRTLFKLFQHPSMAIVKGAGLVMKAIIEEGDKEIATKMQELALSEGALPRHLHTAMFTISTDQRMRTNRQLSRHLVGLWTAENTTALNLLKRILPSGLLAYLDSNDPVPEKDWDRMHIRDNLKIANDQYGKFNKVPEWQRLAGKAAKGVEKFAKEKVDLVLMHWRDKMGIAQKEDRNNMNLNQKPVILRKRRQRIKIQGNWDLFYYRFLQDHARSNLIWNFKTREELRDSLETEMRAFQIDRELGSTNVISWNHHEFEVKYECLSEEIKIGDYYLRLLLEEDESEESEAIKKSYEFFNELYHRFLLTPKINMKCLCLQALAIVYGRCYEEIGPFGDTKYIVGMLERCTDRLERDRLIIFLNKLILNKKNVKELMDSNGIRILVDLLTLAHLHTSRATVPFQSNVIEAAPDMKRESEKEWYYGNAEKERRGPYSFNEMQELWTEGKLTSKTRCWAQGMDGWRPLQVIPQLKWCLLATGQAVLNETDLATLILNMLVTMCNYFPSRDQDNAIIRPLPKVKRLLSDNTCLPHIIQLLLTFDPILVEKVAILLFQITHHSFWEDMPQNASLNYILTFCLFRFESLL
ncbi:PREDICTED: dnaJ homolog subfamily C member 13 [Thamnophis sirtalis]|uniref:DnaJ homolog subfamily C member 13 n=1 Tax=Thamnophis sirtalis TaxID=35019 RepID=A0A6I9Y7M7_9SAUR|nr:PREDICTED: dnaJ homolog subfamily C member 13 [Thamnophis sirtalis]